MILEVNNLVKEYPSFRLDNVSFKMEEGYITGFIGANGAGKSTTLKSILNLTQPDQGEVKIFGLPVKEHEAAIKQDVGFMMGAVDYYPHHKVKTIAKIYQRFYERFDETVFSSYLKRFSIDANKRISALSTGMKVKLALSFALSHQAKLFIFDEPTSGLDPVARDEVLDLFREIIEKGDKSILFSTHITSDLDKCADYILFVKNGKLIADDTKDDLIDSHVLIGGNTNLLAGDLAERMIGYKKNAYSFRGLIKKQNLKTTDNVSREVPDLEDIMVYYNKEDQNESI